jgi:FMN-dependent NADH-azoreductase
MKKLLFVNACIRENSRTEKLSRRYLEKFKDKYQIEEIKIAELNIKPFDAAALSKRNLDTMQGKLDSEDYRLAHRFAEADSIVIAAPYWDCLFPSILRVYLEHICVAGITFAYGENGSPVKMCHADKMIYITTCGGFLPEHPAVEGMIRELGKLFSIYDIRFYAAEGLDIYPNKVQKILEHTLEKM